MYIGDKKIIDLYKRFMNFIISNYPDAIPEEKKNFIMVAYPGELARFNVSYDANINTLVIRLSRDITHKLTPENGRTYYISTLDELNSVKFAVQSVMDMKIPKGQSGTIDTDKIATSNQGYVLDSNKNIIGIVYLDRIPTGAYVHDTNEINDEEIILTEETPQRKPTLSRFFKK